MNTRLHLALTLSALLASPFAVAKDEGIDRFELEQSIEKRSGVDHPTAVRIVDALAAQTRTQPNQRLPISGYLFTHGLNFGLLVDSDDWYMDATFADESGKLVTAPDLFRVYFQNGGIKYELSYKFMFTFLTSDITVKQLDGAVFGRGIGFTTTGGFGIEAAWMPGKNRSGSAILVAPKVGFDAGLTLPRMTFHLRRVQ